MIDKELVGIDGSKPAKLQDEKEICTEKKRGKGENEEGKKSFSQHNGGISFCLWEMECVMPSLTDRPGKKERKKK